MFTPPPSPGPSKSKHVSRDVSQPSPTSVEKRKMGRRVKWTVMAVPLVLVLITLSTRYIVHPAVFDFLDSGFSQLWPVERMETSSHHPRHLDHRQGSSTITSSTTATDTSSTTAATAQALPTVPSTPPALPTPFPQPYDATLSKNFSSPSCFNFFENMTTTAPFRSCRPFSLLLDSSADFLDAQTNLTLMNSIVWGTCSTTLVESQCQANMSWFSNEIQNVCAQDLKDRNAMATSTLTALQAFSVVHDTACLVDPTTNTYCYLDAVHNTNPSDLYYYMLPLGNHLPNSAKSSCSACTRSLMSIYSSALDNATTPIIGLSETYNEAAQQAITDCGQSYASLATNSASMTLPTFSKGVILLLAMALSGYTLV